MPRTHEQLEQAAHDAERWLNELDPEQTPAEDPNDLRAIGHAVIDRAEADKRITEAVLVARNNGRSWARIGMVLGISKQAAQVRYGQLAPH